MPLILILILILILLYANNIRASSDLHKPVHLSRDNTSTQQSRLTQAYERSTSHPAFHWIGTLG